MTKNIREQTFLFLTQTIAAEAIVHSNRQLMCAQPGKARIALALANGTMREAEPKTREYWKGLDQDDQAFIGFFGQIIVKTMVCGSAASSTNVRQAVKQMWDSVENGTSFDYRSLPPRLRHLEFIGIEPLLHDFLWLTNPERSGTRGAIYLEESI